MLDGHKKVSRLIPVVTSLSLSLCLSLSLLLSKLTHHPGKRMLYVSEDEVSDEEFSPTPAKRRKKSTLRGQQSRSLPGPSHPSQQPAGQPLMGELLATILTDIPEVDICPLSSLSSNTPSNSQVDTRLVETFIVLSSVSSILLPGSFSTSLILRAH